MGQVDRHPLASPDEHKTLQPGKPLLVRRDKTNIYVTKTNILYVLYIYIDIYIYRYIDIDI